MSWLVDDIEIQEAIKEDNYDFITYAFDYHVEVVQGLQQRNVDEQSVFVSSKEIFKALEHENFDFVLNVYEAIGKIYSSLSFPYNDHSEAPPIKDKDGRILSHQEYLEGPKEIDDGL
jgi:hypothetical protein